MHDAPLHGRPVRTVERLDDPLVADYANLRDRQLWHGDGPRSGGLFVAEGELVVRRLVESRFRARSLLLTPARLRSMADVVRALPERVEVLVAQRDLVERIVGFDVHRGVLAIGERSATPTLGELAAWAETLVVLEGLTNHDNVGQVFRSAAALGGGRAGVVLSPGCCDPLYRKAIRVSMGHALVVPFARASAWPGDLALLREAGFRVIGLSPGPGSIPIDELAPAGRTALVMGTEGSGLGAGARAGCDQVARIPMTPGVDSLNVAVACAIALHRLAALQPQGVEPAASGEVP